jgi:protein-arginine kinase activator protein McsA
LARVATDDLNALLDAALEEEDYEKASRIRDELNNRNNL